MSDTPDGAPAVPADEEPEERGHLAAQFPAISCDGAAGVPALMPRPPVPADRAHLSIGPSDWWIRASWCLALILLIYTGKNATSVYPWGTKVPIRSSVYPRTFCICTNANQCSSFLFCVCIVFPFLFGSTKVMYASSFFQNFFRSSSLLFF